MKEIKFAPKEKCPESLNCQDGDICLCSSAFDVEALCGKNRGCPQIPLFVSGIAIGKQSHYSCSVKE